MKISITCNFNVGDTVFFLHENKVVTGEVKHVATSTKVKEDRFRAARIETDINYTIHAESLDDTHQTLEEKFCFESKEELLKSL